MAEFCKKELVERINQLKKEKKITIEELSIKTGVSLSTLAKNLGKQTSDIKLTLVSKIAVALDTTIDFLIIGDTSLEVNNSIDNVEISTNILTKEEEAIINNYRMLNCNGQDDLLDYSTYITTKFKYKKIE